MTELPFVSFTKFFKQLTDADILTFEAFDKQSQSELLKRLLPNYDPLWLDKAYRKEIPILLKPESMRINHEYNALNLNAKSGTVSIPLTDELLDFLTETEDKNLYFDISLKRKVSRNNNAIYIGELNTIYTADYDFDRAKELLNEHKPIDLLLYAIGYKPSTESIAGKLAMLLPLFQYGDKAIHTLTFTPPRFGKTRSAKILSGLIDAYLTPMPTPSKLVYDGSKGRYGLAYFYSTLYIDEFDKIQSSKRKDTFRDSYEILLTGMSDGLWTREVSSKVGDYSNIVGFCFMGNIEDMTLNGYDLTNYVKNSRERVIELLNDIVNPYPFVERLTYVEFVTENVQAYTLLNYTDNNRVVYLHPKISRSIIRILQDRVKEKPIYKRPQCELDYHFNALKAVLEVLQIELDDNAIEKAVKGEVTFFDVLTDTETDTETDELTESDIKRMLGGDDGWSVENAVLN